MQYCDDHFWRRLNEELAIEDDEGGLALVGELLELRNCQKQQLH